MNFVFWLCVFFFGDREDGEEAKHGEQGSKQDVPSREHLCGEQLGQRAENEAEHDQVGCRGIFLHGAFDQIGGQEDTADRTDDERSEGEQGHDIQSIDCGGQLFVNAEHEKHLGNADAGENERDGNDDTAEKLDHDACEHGKRARAVDLKNAFGNQTDEKCGNDADDRIEENGDTDFFDFCRTEDHGRTSRHGTEEEVACGNGNVSQRECDQFGKEEQTNGGTDQEFDQKNQAFLEFAFLENAVDGSDQAVVYTEDHCHGAARNARDGHRAADPSAASRREQRVFQILVFLHEIWSPFRNQWSFSDISYLY